MSANIKSEQREAILAALAADRDGLQASVTCPVCGTPLKVTRVPATGGIWVTCEVGCTTAHFKTGQR
jgi:hypothetical protein